MDPFNLNTDRHVEIDMRGARVMMTTPDGQEVLVEISPKADATLTINSGPALSIDDTLFTYVISDSPTIETTQRVDELEKRLDYLQDLISDEVWSAITDKAKGV